MPAPADNRALEALRMRRAELRESKSALEQALAAPAARTAEAWTQRAHVALVELFSDLSGTTSPSPRDRTGYTEGY